MVNAVQVGTRQIALDADGCLLDLSQWDEEVAHALAAQDGIELSAEHWQVLYAVREFYREFDLAPANRALIRYLAQRFGAEVGNSMRLNLLFAGKPARLAGKIAGLPKPANCF